MILEKPIMSPATGPTASANALARHSVYLAAREPGSFHHVHHPMQTTEYTGTDNLEIMQEAVNYNRYLLGVIRSHIDPSCRTLDFGAGAGQFAIPLQQLHFDVVAVEPDSSLRQRLSTHGIVASDSAAELLPASIDAAYTLNVLEHIEDDVSALRELHRALKPGGTLLIYVPAFQLLYSSMDAKVGHVRRYTRASLEAAVMTAGFRVHSVAYVDSLGFFATLLFKFFDRSSGDVNRTALKVYDRAIFPVSRLLDVIAKHWFGKNLLLLAHK